MVSLKLLLGAHVGAVGSMGTQMYQLIDGGARKLGIEQLGSGRFVGVFREGEAQTSKGVEMQTLAALSLALAHLLLNPRVARQPLLQIDLVLIVVSDLLLDFVVLLLFSLLLALSAVLHEALGMRFLTLERFRFLRQALQLLSVEG